MAGPPCPSISTPTRTVALVGNPNTGKSTIFNALTGFRQRVGNFPGVTVDKRTGALRTSVDNLRVDVVDLPGSYSLSAKAEDETILLDVLLGSGKEIPVPDLIIIVIDASNLSRNLFFATQILEIGKPVVVALNMMDAAQTNGRQIDASALSEELGAPVVPMVASRQVGVDALKRVVVESLQSPPSSKCAKFPECVCAELDGLSASLSQEGGGDCDQSTRVVALQTLLDPGGYHEERMIRRCGRGLIDELRERRQRIQQTGESLVELEARVRYAWIKRVVERVVTSKHPPQKGSMGAVDRVLTHRVVGLGVFLAMMALCFNAIYSWAAPLMDAIDHTFRLTGGLVATLIPAGAFQSLIVDGVMAGVGSVLVFLPQILILFLFIAILEDCGYLARAAFLLDRWMGLLGLSGQSFIPLLSSFACAIPGILATRTINDRRDRFVTILIAPLMSCSARLPVYMLLIAAFIPATPLLGGWIGLQAVTLLGLYGLGIVVAVGVALVLKRTILKGEAQAFLMELPAYRWPSVKMVFFRVYEQGREFCVSAGTIIFAVTVVVWALGYYPRSTSIIAEHDAQRAEVRERFDARLAEICEDVPASVTAETVLNYPPIASLLAQADQIEAGNEGAASDELSEANPQDLMDTQIAALFSDQGPMGQVAREVYLAKRSYDESQKEIHGDESGELLRHSILGRMGHWIEPVVRPLGWDWRIGTAAIAAFPAREVVVATMGTLYNLGADLDERSEGLRQQLRSATRPDGTKVYNAAVALSIMVFFCLCCQCGGTLAAIRRETRSWSWPALTFVYMTGLAYLGAWAAYRLALPWI